MRLAVLAALAATVSTALTTSVGMSTALAQITAPPSQTDLDDAIRTGKQYGATIPTPASLIPRKADGKRGPGTLEAKKIIGEIDGIATAEGDVKLTQDDTTIFASRLDADQGSNVVTSSGAVKMLRSTDVITGDDLKYNTVTSIGSLEKPTFLFGKNPTRPKQRLEAYADANRMNFEGENLERFFGAHYSTCKPDAVDWRMTVSELALDRNTNVGTGYNAYVHWKNIPILYLPYMTFPLNNERRSGFLPPTIGSSTSSGIQIAVPYYWNISANKDATITPTIFTKRGVQLANEYRFMDRDYIGQFDGEWLPDDRKAKRDRFLLSLRHFQNLADTFGRGWSATINTLKVSDDAYFRDLSTRISNTAQTNLSRDYAIKYLTDFGSWSARFLSFQTLQDPTVPIGKPYHLAPQITYNARPARVNRFEFNTVAEATDFRHPEAVSGRRVILYPSVSRPFTSPFGFFTPKLGYHLTHYNITDNRGSYENSKRALPIMSLDGGLAFERAMSFGGTAMTQTLEPRLFFLLVPYRDQSKLPQFSTSETDFNFSQIFNENLFVGGDRISDARQLTAATTTRFIEDLTGIERLRASIGQRYYFHTQQVSFSDSGATLGTSGNRSRSDLLLALTGQVTDEWFMDSAFQYSTSQSQFRRTNLSARYAGEGGRLVNFSYRFTRDSLKQVDISTQWPMKSAPGVTLLARANHSLQDKRLLEGLLGVEYNQGCWELRLVAHRFATATNLYSTSIQFQLELKGLSKLGVNPFETLRQNISGYRRSEDRQ